MNPKMIDILQRLPPVTGQRSTPGKGGDESGRDFSELLKSASEPRSARAAVELMRLEMLRGMVNDDGGGDGDSLPLGWQLYRSLELGKGAGQNPDTHGLSVGAPAALPQSSEQRWGLRLYQNLAPEERYAGAIEKAAAKYRLAPELVRAVVKAESNFDHQAVSSVGAQGLMQLMPATAAELGVQDSFDPEQNVMGGSRYLRQMLDRYDGDLDKALAAYNWGMGNLDRSDGQSLPQETRDYIARIKRYLDESV